MPSRRKFLAQAGVLAAGAAVTHPADAVENRPRLSITETVSLCGSWQFRTDPTGAGEAQRWHESSGTEGGWRKVSVPHTWQIEDTLVDYRGIAWYRKSLEVPQEWRDSAVRVEFEAVFHTAQIWVNGKEAGEHARKGYTAFTLDITHLVRHSQRNIISVRVDNRFDDRMVPRGRSSDWAHDGGIYRPVQLLITPQVFIEHVSVEAFPEPNGEGKLTIAAQIRNTSNQRWTGRASFQVEDEKTGLTALSSPDSPAPSIEPGATHIAKFAATLSNAKLWHFDHPHLYRLIFSISDEHNRHQLVTAFGVRQLEARDNAFYLNGERVRLMGVERMAGSNPDLGMAETSEWITHDHDDLKNLNCVFTRVHWPQDKRVLDYCDRHGMLMQLEIPAWGWDTFAGMKEQPDADIVQNALEQLREMVARDFSHPSVVLWGLCNEIGGQNPPAYQFAKRMLQEAKWLDPNRLCSYASNSLDETPERDAAALMDIIETNEYFGTWAAGSAEDAGKHLDRLHAAFPGKPLVISEYGYCACTEDRPEGDERRIEILRTHDEAFRARDFVAGAIFFCYNDYRTHVGDRGVGALTQRVHGVVDLFGEKKPSYEVLRQEASPVESLEIDNTLNVFRLRIKTRQTLPMYALRGYRLRGISYGQGEIPVERQEIELAEVAGGVEITAEIHFTQPAAPLQVKFDIVRPTGFSAYSQVWKPSQKS